MGLNQDVVNETLQCRKDVRCNLELFEEYFKSNLQSLVFCARLEKCLKRGKDSQLRVLAALKQFDLEQETGSETYSNTLKEEFKCFRAAGNPFTEKLLLIFQSVYQQQMEMLQKLQQRKTKLDKKLKRVNAWRKVSNVIFLSGFAAVLVSSTAIAAPLVSVALSTACSISIGSVGKWVVSFWKKYDKEVVWSIHGEHCGVEFTCWWLQPRHFNNHDLTTPNNK
ncbi:hypothetical protein QQ045_023539 [Rhodiola kirilowii]